MSIATNEEATGCVKDLDVFRDWATRQETPTNLSFEITLRRT